MSSFSKLAASLVGWMQSTGHTATQAVSLTPMQGWAMMWAMFDKDMGCEGRTLRNLFFVISGVSLDKGDPFGREVVLWENGGDGAFIDAHVAVDAGVRVDVEHFLFLEIRLILLGMNAVDGADDHAGGVFGADAGLGNDIGH